MDEQLVGQQSQKYIDLAKRFLEEFADYPQQAVKLYQTHKRKIVVAVFALAALISLALLSGVLWVLSWIPLLPSLLKLIGFGYCTYLLSQRWVDFRAIANPNTND